MNEEQTPATIEEVIEIIRARSDGVLTEEQIRRQAELSLVGFNSLPHRQAELRIYRAGVAEGLRRAAEPSTALSPHDVYNAAIERATQELAAKVRGRSG